jgi:hypothetical protein
MDVELNEYSKLDYMILEISALAKELDKED